MTKLAILLLTQKAAKITITRLPFFLKLMVPDYYVYYRIGRNGLFYFYGTRSRVVNVNN